MRYGEILTQNPNHPHPNLAGPGCMMSLDNCSPQEALNRGHRRIVTQTPTQKLCEVVIVTSLSALRLGSRISDDGRFVTVRGSLFFPNTQRCQGQELAEFENSTELNLECSNMSQTGAVLRQPGTFSTFHLGSRTWKTYRCFAVCCWCSALAKAW